MVCEWGMSEALGPVTFGDEDRQIFLGREMGRVKDHSEATAVLIDKEIRALVDAASERAERLLSDNIDKLHLLAEALLERETLSGEDVNEMFGMPPDGGNGPAGGDGDAVVGRGPGEVTPDGSSSPEDTQPSTE